MNGWLLFWLAWGAVFLVAEGAALFNRRTQDTLSEQVWAQLRVDDPRPTPLVWVARGGVIVFCAWLALHLTLGWFTPTHPWPF